MVKDAPAEVGSSSGGAAGGEHSEGFHGGEGWSTEDGQGRPCRGGEQQRRRRGRRAQRGLPRWRGLEHGGWSRTPLPRWGAAAAAPREESTARASTVARAGARRMVKDAPAEVGSSSGGAAGGEHSEGFHGGEGWSTEDPLPPHGFRVGDAIFASNYLLMVGVCFFLQCRRRRGPGAASGSTVPGPWLPSPCLRQ